MRQIEKHLIHLPRRPPIQLNQKQQRTRSPMIREKTRTLLLPALRTIPPSHPNPKYRTNHRLRKLPPNRKRNSNSQPKPFLKRMSPLILKSRRGERGLPTFGTVINLWNRNITPMERFFFGSKRTRIGGESPVYRHHTRRNSL